MHGCDRRCWRMHRCAWDWGESGFLRKLVSKLGKIINAFFFFPGREEDEQRLRLV